jgi:hypothetical protein
MKNKKTLWLVLFLILSILPAVWPLFKSGFFMLHDFTHVARLEEMHRALLAGQFPPRWSDNFGFGYGMPLMHFYAPLAYYFAEIMRLAGVPAVSAIQAAFFVGVLLGAINAYALGREFFGKFGGVLVSLAFTYAPYRAVQFYVRGALSELWATSFLPLCFLGLYKLVWAKDKNERLRYGFYSVVGITGVFLSHNVITLFAAPFLVIWALVWIGVKLAKTKNKFAWLKTTSLWLTGAGIFSLGLSAWFLAPALLEKNLTIVDTIGGGYSYFELHFIYLRQLVDSTFEYGGSILGPDDDISFQLGWWQVLLTMASLAIFGFWWLKNKRFALFNKLKWKNLSQKNFGLKQEVAVVVLLSSALLLVAIFLMTYHSLFVWKTASILQIAQFPWRLLSFAVVFVAILIGFLGVVVENLPALARNFALVAMGVILVVLPLGFFQPNPKEIDDNFYYTDENLITTNMSDILRDYLPITVEKVPAPGMSEVEPEVVGFEQKQGYRYFLTENTAVVTYEVRTFNFPGWKAYIDGQEIVIATSRPNGFMELEIPSGRHEVEVRLEKTIVQKISDWTSLVVLLAFTGLSVWFRKEIFW